MTARQRFLVDHMLVKLGKYLRILGYDTGWDPASGRAEAMRTHELILRANEDARIFVTRNRRLADQYPTPSKLVMVASTDPAEQLREVIKETRLDVDRWLFSRCIRCNVELREVEDKGSIEQLVHPNVYVRHEQFCSCPSCGTVFWKGSHVRNTLRKLGLAGG